MFFDAVYFPASIAWETERVRAFRKKSSLNKNGSYPPTKDPLELSLFISQLRTRVAKVKNTLNLSEIL